MDNRKARRQAAAVARRRTGRSTRIPAVASAGTFGTRPVPSTGPSEPVSEAIEPEALVVSHWIDPGKDGRPHAATIRLTGRRIGAKTTRRRNDTFVHEETIDGVTPGAGPLSISSWVYGLEPGEWAVTAEVLERPGGRGRGARAGAGSIPPADWSWRRWALVAGTPATVKTRWAMLAPLARTPGVLPGSWLALGILGVFAAMLVQVALSAHFRLPIDRTLTVAVIALVSGTAGAKIWYAVLHPGPWRQAILGGWAIDGFLVVAPVVAVAMLVAVDVPVGAFLDIAVPGLFFGVAIGRVGCFLSGCCAGRFTRSRWGVWSSDRTVGARRVPAQLLESAAGLVIAVTALVVVLLHTPRVEGAIFVSAFSAYLVVRQVLLRARAERREFSWRRHSVGAPEVA